MIQKHPYQDVYWVDLDNPTKSEVGEMVSNYNIDLQSGNDLVLPTNSPRVNFYPNYAYIVLHFPFFKHSHRENNVQEIDFIITKEALITSRFDHIDAVHKFKKIIEAESVVDKKPIVNPTGYLFFRLLRELYGSLFDELKYIDSESREIEKSIFSGKEHEMVLEISNLIRVLLDLDRTLSQHKDVLTKLKDYGSGIFGEHFEYHIRSVIDEYGKLRGIIRSQKDIITELRETNNSLLNSKQNEVAKIITVLAFISVPISLILNVFQIDTVSRPIVGSANDFWILVGFILLTGVFLFTFFKYKKWL